MKSVFALTLAATLVNSAGMAHAEAPRPAAGNSAVNAQLGTSPFLGVLSLEYQKGHYGVGIGLPGQLAVTYYQHPDKNSVFYSAGLTYYNVHNVDEYEDNFAYTDRKVRSFGVGGGYRWQWPSGWNVNASASVAYAENTYINDDYWGGYYFYNYLEKQSVELNLGLTAGYKF